MTQPLTPEAGLRALQAHPAEFIDLFTHGSLVVEYDKPYRIDRQQLHTRDEVYVITSGTGTFDLAARRISIKPDDLLFVPVVVEHLFGPFTDDFATWVLFYGPESGETAHPSNSS